MQGFSKDDEGLLGEVGMPTQGSLRMPGPSHESAKLVRKLLQVSLNICYIAALYLRTYRPFVSV